MPVSVRFNRASVNVRTKLVKQLSEKSNNMAKLLRAFKRTGTQARLEAIINAEAERLVSVLLEVFGGGVKGIDGSVSFISDIKLTKPWEPLAPSYVERKRSDSFWFESGELLDYVRSGFAPWGKKPVKSVKLTALPAKKGEKYLTVSMLFTLERLSEPLQSMVVANFLQGNQSKKLKNITAYSDLQAYKLLVNEKLRSFLPDVSEELGRRLTTKLSAEG